MIDAVQSDRARGHLAGEGSPGPFAPASLSHFERAHQRARLQA